MYNPLDFKDLLGDELTQRKEEGYDVSQLEGRIERALYDGTTQEHERLLDLLEKTTQSPAWAYVEPSAL